MEDAAGTVNYIAIIAAAISAFVLGGLWYAPFLFGKAWQTEVGLSDEQLKSGSLIKIFGGSFVLSLAGAFVFAMFLGPKPALDFALGAGFSAGLCWVAGSFGINYLNERKSLKLFFINGGYHTLQYTIYGAILSLLG
ncbi:MAG: DUF1761 domain-containing protein [Rhodospirillaceae bacterium]|nr:DUF1761 domain-containing protein [Rhodospirillaceae bacterium]